MRWNEIAIGVIFASVVLTAEWSRVEQDTRDLEKLAMPMPKMSPCQSRPRIADKPPYPKVALSEQAFGFGQMRARKVTVRHVQQVFDVVSRATYVGGISRKVGVGCANDHHFMARNCKHDALLVVGYHDNRVVHR